MTSKRERTLYDVACVCMSVAFVVVVALSLLPPLIEYLKARREKKRASAEIVAPETEV